MWDFYTTQPEGNSGLEAVNIISNPDAEAHKCALKVESEGKPQGVGQGAVLSVGGYKV
jgi:hypothetical protein